MCAILFGVHEFVFRNVSVSEVVCFIFGLGSIAGGVLLMFVSFLVSVSRSFGGQFDSVCHKWACPEGCVRSELSLAVSVLSWVSVSWIFGGHFDFVRDV